jgi:hypothetical protein
MAARVKAPVWLLFCLAALHFSAPELESREGAPVDADRILAIHEELLKSHLENDPEGVLTSEADGVVVVSRGEVLFPTKSERMVQFTRYLDRVEFERYRDVIPPLVRVSEDGTLGWLIAQVAIAGGYKGEDGERIPIESTWAWIELYEKRDGRWFRVGEVSNEKPSGATDRE